MLLVQGERETGSGPALLRHMSAQCHPYSKPGHWLLAGAGVAAGLPCAIPSHCMGSEHHGPITHHGAVAQLLPGCTRLQPLYPEVFGGALGAGCCPHAQLCSLLARADLAPLPCAQQLSQLTWISNGTMLPGWAAAYGKVHCNED